MHMLQRGLLCTANVSEISRQPKFSHHKTKSRAEKWQLKSKIFKFYIARKEQQGHYTSFYTFCSLMNRPAMPIPVPMHILVSSTFFFCLLHSLRPVTICRAPVHPSG